MLDGLIAAGFRIGACSNKPHDALLKVLGLFDLSRRFHAVIGVGHGEPPKPSPAPYFHVMRTLGCRAEQSVMVGDSITDVKTARAAGAAVVLVPWGYTTVSANALGADAVIDHLDELEAAITALS